MRTCLNGFADTDVIKICWKKVFFLGWQELGRTFRLNNQITLSDNLRTTNTFYFIRVIKLHLKLVV